MCPITVLSPPPTDAPDYGHFTSPRYHRVRSIIEPMCRALPASWRYPMVMALGHLAAAPRALLTQANFGSLRYAYSAKLLWASARGDERIDVPIREQGFEQVGQLLDRYGRLILLSVHARFNVGARVLLDRAGHRTLGIQRRSDSRTWATTQQHEAVDVDDPRCMLRARSYLESGGIVTCLVDSVPNGTVAYSRELPLVGLGRMYSGMLRFARLTGSPTLFYISRLARDLAIEVRFGAASPPPRTEVEERRALDAGADFVFDVLRTAHLPEFPLENARREAS